jgi:hypothetical protein
MISDCGFLIADLKSIGHGAKSHFSFLNAHLTIHIEK